MSGRYRTWAWKTIGSHKQRGFTIENEPYLKYYFEWLASITKVCPLCQTELAWDIDTVKGCKIGPRPNSPTLDRINNEMVINDKNARIICYSCNRFKSNKPLNEFTSLLTVMLKGSKSYSVPITPPIEVSRKMKEDWGRCNECGEPMKPMREGQRFCSPYCRLRSHRRFRGEVIENGLIKPKNSPIMPMLGNTADSVASNHVFAYGDLIINRLIQESGGDT